MRRRRLALHLAVFALAAVWAVWQFGFAGADPLVLFWPRPPERGEPPALDQLVSIDVENCAMLRRVVEAALISQGMPAAAHVVQLRNVLVVRNSPAGHAAVARLVELIEEQATAWPRPYALQRDDNFLAQQQLARRLGSAEEPWLLEWLTGLVLLVDHPSAELTEAVAGRLAFEQQQGRLGPRSSLLDALAHCRRPAADAVPVVAACYEEACNPLRRRQLLALLADLGPQGIDVLAGIFRRTHGRRQPEADYILELFARRPRQSRRASVAIFDSMIDPPADGAERDAPPLLQNLRRKVKALANHGPTR